MMKHTRDAIRPIPALIFTAILLLTTSVGSGAQTSALWGTSGEKWTPESRLPDFSFAGYRRGEEPFRIPTNQISVAAFGAKGDGSTDDTAVFKKAIAAGAGKLILIPPGRFVLNANINVMQALSMAGGLNAFAVKSKIRIFRVEGEDNTKVFKFDYDDVSEGKNLEQNIILKRGDVIVVP